MSTCAQTRVGAGGGDGKVFLHIVTKGGKKRRSGGDFAADRAVLSLGLSGLGAGGGNGLIDDLGVTNSGDRLSFGGPTTLAGESFSTCSGTGSGGGDFALIPVMLNGDCIIDRMPMDYIIVSITAVGN